MQTSTKQIILVAGCIVIGTGLWFGDKKGNPEAKPKPMAEAAADNKAAIKTINWNQYMDSSLAGLSKPSVKIASALYERIKKSSHPQELKSAADSLVQIFSAEKISPAMAYVRELLALKTNEAADWQMAGKEYYRSAQMVSEEWKGSLYQKAILSFEESLKSNPDNPELLTALGVCFVEGSNNPMQGIGYLRKAIEADSGYAEAHFQLGLFAIQSGQMDKAEQRMKKVLEIKPSFISAHLYLGQIYQQMGQKSKALESLQKYKDLNSDPVIRAEVDKYLQELKNT